jgi:alcohol dehydrogenase class IV
MWTHRQPVEIIFGVDQARQLGDLIEKKGYKNGLLIADSFFTTNGMAEKIRSYAKGSLTGIFTEFGPNPTIGQVDGCAEYIRENQYGFVVALGGGSALDCAKAACSV